MRHVKITTPSRLHFSLLDLNGALGRIDGGFGLAIAEPNFQIVAERATDIHLPSSVYRDRAATVLERLQKTYPFPGIRLTFQSEIPMHCGFGSGTQLSLGVVQAVNVLYELGLDVQELARVVGRGGTSGIGIAAFRTGGFIVDGGHRFPEQKSSFLPSSALGDISPPPVLLRYSFPEVPLLIVMPNCSRIYGDKEIELFKTLCPQPEWVAQKLSHILLMQILPALVEGDMPTFGKALNQIQTFGWKKVEIDAQGTELQLTLDFLRDSGAFGAGVSSWGSAICVVGEDIERLRQDTEAFLRTLPDGGSCFVTQASDVGAQVVSG
ncbi:beta-ribofuranosylaminobenzene 5'-phosphate synthase [Candidatus Poribacteria bacterium]|nr:MAG: beta-ribofuranosylaminobenzene 5'-phosphate synthase [Candidatus Poribacteria bacterium]